MPGSTLERSSPYSDFRQTIDQSSSSRRRHRPRRTASRYNTRLPTPSLAVLSLLATFCAESVVAIHPATYRCPRFLCPFLPASHSSLSNIPSPFPPTAPIQLQQSLQKRRIELSRRSSPNGKVPQKLPTKYLKGQDGRYHPESSWSLNGQTLTCAWVSPSPSAVDEMDSVDTSLSPADVGLPQNSALTTPSSSSNSQPPDDLPAGWATQPPRSAFYQVPVIVVFALTLTLFITVLIASCALLRRKRRSRRLAQARKEASAELEEGPEDGHDSFWSKQLHKQKRKWAKSSARWRSNTHVSMRKRRGRGPTNNSSISVAHSSRTSTEHLEVSGDQVMQENPTSQQASLPPAYPIQNSTEVSTEASAGQAIDVSSTMHAPKPLASSEACTSHEPALCASSRLGAHIATDDKAVLEQMANNISAPESHGIVETTPQAPEWDDGDEGSETELAVPSTIRDFVHFPSPGSHVTPTILSPYDDDTDVEKVSTFSPSSPQSDALPALSAPSAPPMEDD